MKDSSAKFQREEPELYAHMANVLNFWHNHTFVEGEVIQGVSGMVKVAKINYKKDGSIQNIVMEPTGAHGVD